MLVQFHGTIFQLPENLDEMRTHILPIVTITNSRGRAWTWTETLNRRISKVSVCYFLRFHFSKKTYCFWLKTNIARYTVVSKYARQFWRIICSRVVYISNVIRCCASFWGRKIIRLRFYFTPLSLLLLLLCDHENIFYKQIYFLCFELYIPDYSLRYSFRFSFNIYYSVNLAGLYLRCNKNLRGRMSISKWKKKYQLFLKIRFSGYILNGGFKNIEEALAQWISSCQLILRSTLLYWFTPLN